MKLVHRDPHGLSAKLVPETLDDLWHLSHLIDKGDLVRAWTLRTKETKEEKLRGQKAAKAPVELTVRVEDVEFALFADRLRVRGPIATGTEELGSYHTLTFEADGQTELTLSKERGFRPHHWDRIREAQAAAKRPLVTILCIDDEEATIAVLRQYGVHLQAAIKGPSGGKMYRTDEGRDAYFGEVLAALRRARPDGAPLVVVGPGFTRESFLAFVRERDAAWLDQFVTEGTGQSGMVGVQEALKRGIVERIQKEQQVAADTQLVEEIFAEIGRDGAVGYGAVEVERLLNAGAVRLLVVSDELLRTPVGEGLLDLARHTNAKSHIVATTHEAGKKLQGLGGAAALLRYKPT
jgi:protein pelota